jgi:DNA-binding transcriptional LysR family regulator
MDTRLLRCFVTVAELRHFTRAAEVLNVAQPAVSQRIRDLERMLAVQLFDRTLRRVELTDAGHLLLELARPILRDLDEAEHQVRTLGPTREHVVHLATVRWMPGVDITTVLRRFRAANPMVRVHVHEHTTDTMLTMIVDGRIDLAILQRPERLPRNVVVEPLRDDEFVLITPANHVLSRRRRVRVKELADQDFVVLERGSGVERTVMQAAHEAGFEPHIAMEAMQLDTVRDAVAAGIGIAIVPRSRIDRHDTGLGIVALGPPRLVRPLALAHRREPLTPAAQALKAIMQATYG